MQASAYRILNQSLTEAVAKPMMEMQRKNRMAMTGLLLLGAVSILTSIGWVDARGKSYQLREAWEILEAGFTPRTSPYSVSPYVMEWKLEDGTVMLINIPVFTGVSPV